VARILEQQGSAGKPTPVPSPMAPAGSAGALPPGHPPIGAAPVKAADDTEVAEVALKYDSPASWKKEEVNRPMRKAQFTLPRAADDSEDGQLIVYYFGRGEGGTIELNIERWRNMFTTADGQPVGDDVVKRAVTEVNGLKTTTLGVTGRYADPMGRPNQSGPTSSEFRMLAAIVETPDGPWFFKAVGPAATMASHAASFEQFIRTVRR
jgi:hypothetical protein